MSRTLTGKNYWSLKCRWSSACARNYIFILHSRHNTRLQWIGQRQLQDENKALCSNIQHMFLLIEVQYIPRNMHTVFALLCFVVVIHWLIFPYPSGLLHWHCGNLTIAPVPAKQPWWIWINTSCEFIMKDCITTTKQSTTKPCAYLLGYTVSAKPYSACELILQMLTVSSTCKAALL